MLDLESKKMKLLVEDLRAYAEEVVQTTRLMMELTRPDDKIDLTGFAEEVSNSICSALLPNDTSTRIKCS